MYKSILAAAILSVSAMAHLSAQEGEKKEENKMPTTLSISNGGITLKKDGPEKRFSVSSCVLDIGLNSLQDKTDYKNLGVAGQQLIKTPDAVQNGQIFNLRREKSWNVNIYPVVGSYRLMKTAHQKIYLSSGLGLQMYNFRFNRPVTYLNVTTPEIYMDSLKTITRNKLGFTYLTVPLMLTFKTKASEKTWLVYGAGVTGGYRLSSWTKQISNEYGKQKNHDKFNFSDFNACLTGEIGLDHYFRLYASYQLTPLHNDGVLDQRPFCIGLRIWGI